MLRGFWSLSIFVAGMLEIALIVVVNLFDARERLEAPGTLSNYRIGTR